MLVYSWPQTSLVARHKPVRQAGKLQAGALDMRAWCSSDPQVHALVSSLRYTLLSYCHHVLQAAQQQIQDLAQAADAGQCQITGKVDDLSDCTYKSVHSLNHRHVNPVVRELVKTAFFRYFKASI
jgi:hypothetical protein